MAEQRDLSIRAIAVFGISLFATIVLVMLITGWLTGFWHKAYVAQQPPPLPVSAASHLPPRPRLQVDAPVDLQHWRAIEDTMLYSNAVPIDRAMKLIVERGVK